MIEWVADDGGRGEAGRKGTTNDCVVRAAAIASGRPYGDVYDMVNALARRERPRAGGKRSDARLGVQNPTLYRLMEALGAEWTPTMQIGQGCRVHLRADELPRGRLVVNLSRHVAAVIDGTLHDLYDCSREGTRCVYGYWRFP